MASLAKTTKAKRGIKISKRKKRRIVKTATKLRRLKAKGYLVTPNDMESLLS